MAVPRSVSTNDYGESWETAKPVRHAKAAGKSHAIPTLVNVEQDILRISDLLDERATELYTANRDTTTKQGQWLRHRDKVVRRLLAGKDRTSEDSRDSLARTEQNEEGIWGAKLWEAWKFAEGHEKSIKEEMNALRSRLSALQSVIRNLRDVTGLG